MGYFAMTHTDNHPCYIAFWKNNWMSDLLVQIRFLQVAKRGQKWTISLVTLSIRHVLYWKYPVHLTLTQEYLM